MCIAHHAAIIVANLHIHVYTHAQGHVHIYTHAVAYINGKIRELGREGERGREGRFVEGCTCKCACRNYNVPLTYPSTVNGCTRTHVR